MYEPCILNSLEKNIKNNYAGNISQNDFFEWQKDVHFTFAIKMETLKVGVSCNTQFVIFYNEQGRFLECILRKLLVLCQNTFFSLKNKAINSFWQNQIVKIFIEKICHYF